MWKKQRQQEILDLLDKRLSLSIADLVKKFNLSEITLRKDVKELADKGLLSRKYGVIYKAGSEKDILYTGTSVDSRKEEDFLIKKRLAYAVFPKILKASTIFIDDSTTVSNLLPLLKNLSGLTVITPSILAINYLSEVPNIHTIGLGGTVCTIHKSFIGSVVVEQMSKYQVDIAFFGCYGISEEAGCLENFFSITDIKKMGALCSKENIVLMSSSKWERNEGALSLSWQNISSIFSDKMPESPRLIKILEQNKIKVELC